MGLRDFARLTSLLRRSGRVPSRPLVDERFRERRGLTAPGGLVYDLMEPTRPAEGLVIPLHGSTLNGKDDPRLQHFARCLALSGGICAVPTLPGLSDMQWIDSDLSALVGLIDHLHETTGRRVGLIGFSFAGSYALLAAARAAAGRVRFVLSIGGYHSLDRVYDHFFATRTEEPTTGQAWDDRIYLHLTIAHRQATRLGLAPGLVEAVDSLLRRYCNQAADEEKRTFFEQHLRPLDLVTVDCSHRDRAMLAAVSPAGQLDDLDCQVGLIHDPADGIVPADHAEALFAELGRTARAADHRLLVTSLMRHVNLSGALNMREIVRLFQILSPLVRPESPPESRR